MMIVLNKYILLNLFNCTGHILYYTIHIIMQYNVKITKIIINIGHKNNDKIKNIIIIGQNYKWQNMEKIMILKWLSFVIFTNDNDKDKSLSSMFSVASRVPHPFERIAIDRSSIVG